jgi:hypothetical protein
MKPLFVCTCNGFVRHQRIETQWAVKSMQNPSHWVGHACSFCVRPHAAHFTEFSPTLARLGAGSCLGSATTNALLSTAACACQWSCWGLGGNLERKHKNILGKNPQHLYFNETHCENTHMTIGPSGRPESFLGVRSGSGSFPCHWHRVPPCCGQWTKPIAKANSYCNLESRYGYGYGNCCCYCHPLLDQNKSVSEVHALNEMASVKSG